MLYYRMWFISGNVVECNDIIYKRSWYSRNNCYGIMNDQCCHHTEGNRKHHDQPFNLYSTISHTHYFSIYPSVWIVRYSTPLNANRLFVHPINFSVKKRNNVYRKLGFVTIILTVRTNQMKLKIAVIVPNFCVTIRYAFRTPSFAMVWIIAGESRNGYL